MEPQLNYIISKVDLLEEEVKKVDKNLALTVQLLQTHIEETKELQREQKDIVKHVTVVRMIGRIGAWLVGTLITFLVAVFSIK